MFNSVLIIIENDDLRANLELALRAEKFRVFNADEGLSALTTLSLYSVDMIIIDNPLHLISIEDFLSILDDNPAFKNIPKIIFADSTDVLPDINTKGYLNLHTLKKPFKLEELLNFVHKKFSRKTNTKIRQKTIAI